MTEAVTAPPTQIFTISERAAKMVRTIMKNEGKEDAALRVTVAPGGCAGYSYGLDFADKPEENDLVLESGGVKVYIDRDLEPLVHGASLDYTESLQATGFVLDNPNASHSCGCGKSFS